MSELEVIGGKTAEVRRIMSIMDTTGDTKILWNPRDADEVETAKATFDKLTAKGFSAFRVDKKGEPGKKITEFAADAEKLILVPQMAGGA